MRPSPDEGVFVCARGRRRHVTAPCACSTHLPTCCCWQHFLCEPHAPLWTGGRDQGHHLEHGKLWVSLKMSCLEHVAQPRLCAKPRSTCSHEPHPSPSPSFSSDPIWVSPGERKRLLISACPLLHRHGRCDCSQKRSRSRGHRSALTSRAPRIWP